VNEIKVDEPSESLSDEEMKKSLEATEEGGNKTEVSNVAKENGLTQKASSGL